MVFCPLVEMTITWIRHGETEWNAQGLWQGHSESPLSEKGREQALALGRRLAHGPYRFDRVYSSDLERASVSARLALPDHEITQDSRLREIHFGIFEGRSLEQLEPEERKELLTWWKLPYQRALPGGESMSDLRRRVDEWRSELAPHSHIAVFTHGGVIRDTLWRETTPPVHGAWSFQIDNASLTVINYTPRRNLIQRVNDVAHLEES